MRKFTISFILLLSALTMARGQTVYQYRYWLDNDRATMKTGSTSAEVSLSVSTEGLAAGIHVLHFQAGNGTWSSVNSRYFLKAAITKDVKARYWFDEDSVNYYQTSMVSGVLDLNILKLEPGIHALHYQTFTTDGCASSVCSQFINVTEVQIGTLAATVWIDNGEATRHALTGDPIVLDISALKRGTHQLHVLLRDSHGITIGQKTAAFEARPYRQYITLAAALETFSSDEDLNFRNVHGLRAYTAAGFDKQTNEVLMHRVFSVPAGTGLLLTGTAGTTYEVPCEESATVYVNLLEPTLEATTIDASSGGYLNYILATENGETGFTQAAEGSFLEACRAYLRIPGSSSQGVRRLRIRLDNEPGDTNEDGVVDVADIATVISHMAGNKANTFTNVDVNADGTVDVADIIAIISEMAAQARQQDIED